MLGFLRQMDTRHIVQQVEILGLCRQTDERYVVQQAETLAFFAKWVNVTPFSR